MNIMKLYLDNCCFNRPYDDQSSIGIRLETEAKLYIQNEIKNGTFSLYWSYILDYENSKNPFEEKKSFISSWRNFAVENITETQQIIDIAISFAKSNIKKLYSLHLACAIFSECDYFLTTDRGILKKSPLVKDIAILNPVQFIAILEEP